MQARQSGRLQYSPLRLMHKVKSRSCNLCGGLFRPHNVFERYCAHCREENELLRFGDWLPEMGENKKTKTPA